MLQVTSVSSIKSVLEEPKATERYWPSPTPPLPIVNVASTRVPSMMRCFVNNATTASAVFTITYDDNNSWRPRSQYHLKRVMKVIKKLRIYCGFLPARHLLLDPLVEMLGMVNINVHNYIYIYIYIYIYTYTYIYIYNKFSTFDEDQYLGMLTLLSMICRSASSRNWPCQPCHSQSASATSQNLRRLRRTKPTQTSQLSWDV